MQRTALVEVKAVKSAAAAAATLWSPFCSAATVVALIRSRPFLLAPAATLGARQTPPGSRGLDPSQSSASNILMWLHDGHITLMFLMPCLKEKSFACRVKMASSKLEMIARPNPDWRHAPGQGSSSLLEDTEGRGLIRILCWLAASAWSDWRSIIGAPWGQTRIRHARGICSPLLL